MTVDGSAQTVDDAALLAVIVGQSPIGVGVFDTDARYVRVNPALQSIVGSTSAGMIGRTVCEVVPGEIGAFADTRLREVLTTGRPVIGAELEGPLPSEPGNRSLVVSYFRLEGPDGACWVRRRSSVTSATGTGPGARSTARTSAWRSLAGPPASSTPRSTSRRR